MIVGHMNPARIKWDLFIILLAVYNSICLPLEIAFRPAFIITNPFVKIMDLIIDFLFLIDILISFRTTYIHPISGDEIIESKLIAKNYIAGRFWIDFFSTIPFEKFIIYFKKGIAKQEAEKYVIISCLKLIRVLRLSRLINYMNSSDDFKLQMRLLKLTFILLLYIHITGCAWYFIAELDLDLKNSLSPDNCSNNLPNGIWIPN
jgi:hypothetical protein